MKSNADTSQSAPTAVADEELQLVCFAIGDRSYGIEIAKVQEIMHMVEIPRVPQAPQYVQGVLNLRGKVIPIVSLRRYFDLGSKEQDKNTRIVVVETGGNTLGLIVDAVTEVLRLPADTIEPPPDNMPGVNAEYIKGVAVIDDHQVIFLDLSKLSDIETLASLSQ